MPATAAGSAEPELDPRLALVLSQQAAARSAALSSWVPRIDLATWGLIWLLAYGTLWIAARGAAEGPPAWAFVIFFGLLAAGMVGSAIAGAKHGGQMVGPSSRAGMLYGWTWMIAFGVGMSTVGIIVNRYDLHGAVVGVLFNSLTALIAGILYMAGSALFKDPPMLWTGAVMASLGPIGALVGLPTGYLVMALVGGGLMLAGFVIVTWRSRRPGRIRSGPGEPAEPSSAGRSG